MPTEALFLEHLENLNFMSSDATKKLQHPTLSGASDLVFNRLMALMALKKKDVETCWGERKSKKNRESIERENKKQKNIKREERAKSDARLAMVRVVDKLNRSTGGLLKHATSRS